MRFISVLIFFLIIQTSCGEKKQVKNRGETTLNGDSLDFMEYTRNDSFFRASTIKGKGRLIQAAKDEKSLRDSTFSERLYLLNGRLVQEKAFLNGIPEGIWTTYSDNGQMLSLTDIKNGKAVNYSAWFPDGKLRVMARTNVDGSMSRYEYYENGAPFQSFEVDSLGIGPCTTYYANHQPREIGRLLNFKPFGYWKRFDSTGRKLEDTLFSIERK
jgi:antitoxin component YwqK of YwqJK toxin-antitoxin module